MDLETFTSFLEELQDLSLEMGESKDIDSPSFRNLALKSMIIKKELLKAYKELINKS